MRILKPKTIRPRGSPWREGWSSGGHEVVVTVDGKEARSVLERDDHPKLAILDW